MNPDEARALARSIPREEARIVASGARVRTTYGDQLTVRDGVFVATSKGTTT